MVRSLVLSVFVLTLSALTAQAADTPDPTGLWLTENKRSAIKVERCGESLCGSIAWIIADGMKTDSKNPDAAKRDKPMCKLPLLWGFKNNAKNLKVWEGGKIYKADEGDIYNATLTVKDANTLNVRGYIGMPLLGKSQTWKRVSAKDYPACK